MAEISNNPFLVKVILEAKTWQDLAKLQLKMNAINGGYQFNWSDVKRDANGYYCDVLIDARSHKLPDQKVELLPSLEVMK